MLFFLRDHPLSKLYTREHLVPLLGYGALLLSCIVAIWLALSSLAADYADYTDAADTLDRLEGRQSHVSSPPGLEGATGSPFLEGHTQTIAGAALQQRVVAAVTAAGGDVLSSQLDLQGSDAARGLISLSVNCEIDQNKLQELIYDLETGMPFLFLDQLVVQTPQIGGKILVGSETRLHVQLDVSGQWQVGYGKS